ncbi:MAG: hypothetical protein C5B51_02295 [Terriglobia bacterium]|nr:MAG: hypothetical protein C5B51_02295 [Terriglobia bacterium]
MPFCANCGAQVEGRFCAKCGTPVAGDVPPASAQPAGPEPPPLASGAGLTDNVASALCYVLTIITGILFLVLQPYNRNRTIRFHAFQAIFLFVAWIVVVSAINILFGMMRLYFLSPLAGSAFFILWIYMIVTAYQGKTVVLPVIGPLAQQQA